MYDPGVIGKAKTSEAISIVLILQGREGILFSIKTLRANS